MTSFYSHQLQLSAEELLEQSLIEANKKFKIKWLLTSCRNADRFKGQEINPQAPMT